MSSLQRSAAWQAAQGQCTPSLKAYRLLPEVPLDAHAEVYTDEVGNIYSVPWHISRVVFRLLPQRRGAVGISLGTTIK
jgi:hypothetical protein